MMKLFTLILVVTFVTSCGVFTSSSSSSLANSNSTVPTDPNSTVPTDPNSTDPNSTIPTDPNSTISKVCSEDSVFECNGAVYDKNSCSALSYKTASDASYNGKDPAENGSDFFNVANEGLSIRSEHLEGSSADSAKTWVTLYYKSFPTPKDLGLQGYTGYLKSGFFYLLYDIAWSDTSIANVDRIMYVKTNQGKKPACYRLNLNSVDGASIDVQKVYK